MKLDVVHNIDGPLARSTTSSSSKVSGQNIIVSGVEERLKNIEDHVGVICKLYEGNTKRYLSKNQTN
ncbi:hypothetical protein HK096_004586 [Nowakowskiella sp. JEL0078]|nr:hypothetical protein HK096_004586 [Nowakowskiella sp. JEL0078]